MTEDVTLRRYRAGDDDRIRELHEVAMRDVDALADPSAFDDALPEGERLDGDLDEIGETYLEPGGEFLVGECDGEIVAMGAFKPVSETRAEIKRVRVDPDYQRRGFGRHLLERLEAIAAERGFTEFVLDTTARQTGAQRFFERNGYRENRRESIADYEILFYRKSIDAN